MLPPLPPPLVVSNRFSALVLRARPLSLPDERPADHRPVDSFCLYLEIKRCERSVCDGEGWPGAARALLIRINGGAAFRDGPLRGEAMIARETPLREDHTHTPPPPPHPLSYPGMARRELWPIRRLNDDSPDATVPLPVSRSYLLCRFWRVASTCRVEMIKTLDNRQILEEDPRHSTLRISRLVVSVAWQYLAGNAAAAVRAISPNPARRAAPAATRE